MVREPTEIVALIFFGLMSRLHSELKSQLPIGKKKGKVKESKRNQY